MAEHGPLYEVAEAIFDRLEFAFLAASRAPERRFVHVGTLPEDFSEQLVVAVETVGPGTPSFPGESAHFGGGTTVMAELSAFVFRDVPTMDEAGTPPIPEDMSAVSLALCDDGWLLLSTLIAGVDDGSLVGVCRDVTIGPMEARGPSGGTAGFRVPISVSL